MPNDPRLVRGLLMLCLGMVAEGQNGTAAAAEPTGFVVVELFTSEGCSSCPPADKLFAELVKDGAIGLSYHVDYWDKLGWKDRFSSAEFSKRQRDYAKALETKRVYTPQMIVNGQTEFVGSNRKLATAAIETARKTPPTHKLTLPTATIDRDSLKVSYQIDGPLVDVELTLAIVQREAVTDVGSGENADQKLRHVSVVRSLATIKVEKTAKDVASIKLPDGIRPSECRIVAFLQSPRNSRILTAAKRALPE